MFSLPDNTCKSLNPVLQPGIRALIFFLVLAAISSGSSLSQPGIANDKIKCGADQTDLYIPALKGKRIAVFANQTSRVGDRHLVDTLLSLGINVRMIFSAEHGFKGDKADGILIDDNNHSYAGIPVISLYGRNKKPEAAGLSEIDLVLFDVQDVGARFYTFISSLHYIMEACAETGKDVLILDRPNPNGNYIDGPVLQKGFESFIGMHPVPVVHGMTVAEYARMINGEGWLSGGLKCNLSIIPCKNYQHSLDYVPPVPPSPNLPNIQAIRLYPSLAFFEGTVISEGRGTEYPFQVFGCPGFKAGNFEFTPVSKPGFSLHPEFENELCRGTDLRNYIPGGGKWSEINLDWLIIAYQSFEDKEHFFKPYFDKLAGTDQLRLQIENGKEVKLIKESWSEDLAEFKKSREKYLLYP